MIGYIRVLFFRGNVSISVCLCPRLIFFPPPASIPCSVPSRTCVFLTQVSLGIDERGVRFLEDVRLIFQWHSDSANACKFTAFCPQALLLNHRLTNRPYSICLREKVKFKCPGVCHLIDLMLSSSHLQRMRICHVSCFQRQKWEHAILLAQISCTVLLICIAHMHACMHAHSYMACVNTLEHCFMWIMVTSCEL